MNKLEALQAVAAFALVPHSVNHLLHQLCSLCVVSLRPVIPSSGVPCYSNIQVSRFISIFQQLREQFLSRAQHKAEPICCFLCQKIFKSSFCLTMDKVVWSKKGTNPTSSYAVHSAGLQVNEQSSGNILSTCRTTGLITNTTRNVHPKYPKVIVHKLQSQRLKY